MRRLTLSLTLAAGLAGLAAPTSVVAQAGLAVRITPRAGVLTPADWLYIQYSHFGIPPVEWTETSILRAPMVGLDVEVEIPGTGVWIRGEVLRTLDGITAATHKVLRETTGFDPPRVEKTTYRVATAVTTGTLDLAFPTLFSIGPIQPYVTVGVGGSRLDFDTDPFQDLENVILPQSGVVATANLGVGATVRILGLTLDLQVRDSLSRYWGRLQHNVMLMGGLTWPIL